jgi:hypothetical protein
MKNADKTMTEFENLILKIQNSPELVEFENVIDVINNTYNYSPTLFSNGVDGDNIINKAGENEGSCKIFSFATMQNLSKQQTLHCFGKYYREDVLKHPDHDNHQNIRTFIKHGWENIKFKTNSLSEKQ